jgi:hypothetical protein
MLALISMTLSVGCSPSLRNAQPSKVQGKEVPAATILELEHVSEESPEFQPTGNTTWDTANDILSKL